VGKYLHRFGIVDHVPHEYAMLIGAEDTTLLKLAAGYAMIDNGGKEIHPTFIDRVQDRNGTTIYRADKQPCASCAAADYDGGPPPVLPDTREQIADARSAYQVVTMMEGVVQRGTGRSIASLDRPLAGKTGTTNDSNDTWFIGFTPDLVCGVYMGFDQPRTQGPKEQGSSVALPVFIEFMQQALKDKPAIPFRIPPGLTMARVREADGLAAGPGDTKIVLEPFKPGTVPLAPGPVLDGSVEGSTPGEAPLRVPAASEGTGGIY